MSFLLVFTANAFGAIIVSVDLDDATPGIQNNRIFGAGQSVTAGVFMELTSPSNLAIYNFSVRYDTSELTFVSRAESAFGVLTETDTTNPVNTTTGTIFRIDGSTFGPAQTAPFGPTRVATLVFTTTNPTGGINDIDIIAGLFQSADDLFFDNAFNNVNTTVTFNGASISAVPEPGSVMLLAAGGAGLFWFRRRCSLRALLNLV
jgi:hypothetical protein